MVISVTDLNQFEVFILAGGKGERLRSVISDIPKPMAPIANKPFLAFLLQKVQDSGFKNVCLLVGYKSEVIEAYVKDNFPGLSIRYSKEVAPLGTGGAVDQAIKSSKFDQFLVLNGDTFFDIDLAGFAQRKRKNNFNIALKKNDNPGRYGAVEVDAQCCITCFREKDPERVGPTLINGGIYCFDRDAWGKALTNVASFSLETLVLPMLLTKSSLWGETYVNNFIDIGIPEDYLFAQRNLESWVGIKG